MKITKFEKHHFALLRTEIDNALKTVAEKYGLKSMHLGNISYSSDGLSFTGQLKVEVDVTDNADAKKAIDNRNESNSLMLGFSKNIVGEKFSTLNKTFVITDLKPGRGKYPIIAKCDQDDRNYKFPLEVNFNNKEIKSRYALR